MNKQLIVSIIEFLAGLLLLYKAFQLHGYLEGAITALGLYIGVAALVGFLVVHDGVHRFQRATKALNTLIA